MNYAERCVSVLRDAVGEALSGAKRPALFISGGLDSAIIQSIAHLDNLYCCTWDDCDNLTMARVAARQHEVVPVTFTRDEMVEVLPAVYRLTGGTATWSQCCQWFMAAHAAHDGCDVVLTGECADERFGGYARYRAAYWIERARHDPHLESYQKFVDQDTLTVRGQMARDGGAPLEALLANESAAIAAHGLVARYPFGANAVQEFAASLPDDQLVTDAECKHCLRDAARMLGVPAEICDEKTKKGLFVPQTWRPDGEPLWSRKWFNDLMVQRCAPCTCDMDQSLGCICGKGQSYVR